MDASVLGLEDPRQGPVYDAGNLNIQSSGLVLAGVQLGVIGPGPAPKEGAVNDQLGCWVEVLHDEDLVIEGGGDQWRVGGDDAGGSGPGDAVELDEQLLGQDVAQAGQGQAHAQVQSQHPGPKRLVDRDSRRGSSRTSPGPHCGGILVQLFMKVAHPLIELV